MYFYYYILVYFLLYFIFWLISVLTKQLWSLKYDLYSVLIENRSIEIIAIFVVLIICYAWKRRDHKKYYNNFNTLTPQLLIR